MMLLFWGSVSIWVSAVVGGATGFGAALIAAPFMLLAGFSVEDVVIINLVAGVVTRIGVSLRLRSHINWRRVALLVTGGLPGAWLGALPVLAFPEHALKRVVGIVVVLCGLGMAAARWQQPYMPSTRAQLAAGFVSGYLSTTTSLNGPPIVLLLAQRRPAPAVVHRRPGRLLHAHQCAVPADPARPWSGARRHPVAGPARAGGHRCGRELPRSAHR